MQWLAIAVGGAVGAVTRHGLTLATARVVGTTFPWGTLLVNLLGCAAIGVAFVLLDERPSSPTLRALGTSEWGFSQAGPGLDHVLVRGLMPQGPERHWPEGLRRHGEVLLSDHAPVELEVR